MQHTTVHQLECNSIKQANLLEGTLSKLLINEITIALLNFTVCQITTAQMST
jgi:hypothetical protein